MNIPGLYLIFILNFIFNFSLRVWDRIKMYAYLKCFKLYSFFLFLNATFQLKYFNKSLFIYHFWQFSSDLLSDFRIARAQFKNWQSKRKTKIVRKKSKMSNKYFVKEEERSGNRRRHGQFCTFANIEFSK